MELLEEALLLNKAVEDCSHERQYKHHETIICQVTCSLHPRLSYVSFIRNEEFQS